MFSKAFAALWRNATPAETRAMRDSHFPISPVEQARLDEEDDPRKFRVVRVDVDGVFSHCDVETCNGMGSSWHQYGCRTYKTEESALDAIKLFTRKITRTPVGREYP